MVMLNTPNNPWESADLLRMASHQSWQWTASAVGLSLNLEQLWGYTSPASPLAAAQAAVATPDPTTCLPGLEVAREIPVWKKPYLNQTAADAAERSDRLPLYRGGAARRDDMTLCVSEINLAF